MKRSGFTLIEVLIASSLFAMVAIVGSATLAATYKTQDQVTVVRTRQETVRSVLELLSRQIKFATNISVVTSGTDSSIVLTEPSDDPAVDVSNPNGTPAIKYSVDRVDANKSALVQQKGYLNGEVFSNDSTSPVRVTDESTFIVKFQVKQTQCSSSTFNGANGRHVVNSPVYVYLNVYPRDDHTQPLESSIIATPRAYISPVESTCSRVI